MTFCLGVHVVLCWRADLTHLQKANNGRAFLHRGGIHGCHHVIQEGLWLRSLFSELSIPFTLLIKVYLDNTGAIALSTAAKFHQRSKHIDIRYHFIHEYTNNNIFQLIWVPSHKNIANILTKPLSRPTFVKFSSLLGLATR